MAQEDELIEVGRVSGLYGVRGWVRIHSYTQPRANILEYGPWHLQVHGQWSDIELIDGRMQGKDVVARLKGFEDRDDAAQLVNATIAIDRAQLPKPGPDEYYWSELIGLKVVTTEGMTLGTVDHLMETGANDVLVVAGERERLIPFTPGNAVSRVDLAARVITVDWDPEF